MLNDAQIRLITRVAVGVVLVVLAMALAPDGGVVDAAPTPPGSSDRLAGLGEVLSNFDVQNGSDEKAIEFTFKLVSEMASYAVEDFWNDQETDNPEETTFAYDGSLTWTEGTWGVEAGEIAHFGYTVNAGYGPGTCPDPIGVDKEWLLLSGSQYHVPGTQIDWCGGPPGGTLAASHSADAELARLQQGGRYDPAIRNMSSTTLYIRRYANATPGSLALSDLMRGEPIWNSRVSLDLQRMQVLEGGTLKLQSPLEPSGETWLVFMYEVFPDATTRTPIVTAFQAIWVEGSLPDPAPPNKSFFALAGRDDPVSSLFVQNLDVLRGTTAEARLRPHEGAGVTSTLTLRGIPPGAHESIEMDEVERLADDAFATVIEADHRIASGAVHRWSDGSSAAVGQLTPGTELIVPLIVRNWVSQYSTVIVQNTDEDKGAVLDVSLYQQGSAQPAFSQQYRIDPGRAITLDLLTDPEFADVPEPFLGSMRLVARKDTELTAEAQVQQTTSPGATYSYEAQPPTAAAPTLYAPLFRNGYWGFTGIHVANPNEESVDVEVEFHGSETTGNDCYGQSYTQGPVTIPPYSSQNFWQGEGGGHPLPGHCFGSAVIRVVGSEMGILAIVNDSVLDEWDVKASAAYLASSAVESAPALAVPYVSDHASDWNWTSGVQIMNVSATDTANVTMAFVEADGTHLPLCPNCTATVKPGSAANLVLVPGSLGHMFDGERGSAIITGDQPLTAIVNTFANVESFGDRDSSTYNAIPIH